MRHSRTVLFALFCAVVGCRPSVVDSSGVAAPGGVAGAQLSAEDSFAARAPRRVSGSPLSLTASDGTGLRLVSLKAKAVAETPLAFTEVHLTFENPSDRVLEGTFRIALAQGASVSRFAMRIDDAWQEGEVVEKQRARVAYEDFLHRKQDPALLEQSAGNEFSARVFPIPARGKKELIISYSEELAAGAPYTFPLAGLPRVENLDVALLDGTRAGASNEIVAMHWAGDAPDRDFVVERRKLPAHQGLRSGDLALVRVRPLTTSAPDPLSSAVILVDTSASRALSFASDLALVQKLAARVAEAGGAKAPLAVIAFDQTQETVFEGEAGAFGSAALDKLRARGALGASNLEQALSFASEVARTRGAHRLVLVTDGVATAGETDSAKLGAALGETIRARGIERIDAVVTSGVRDDAALRMLVRSGLPRDGIVVDGDYGFAEVARRIGQRTQSKLAVKVEGARWWTPRTLDAMQPGDEALVYAEIQAGAPVRVTVGDAAPIAVALAEVDKPLLERSWAKAKIASLLEDPTATKPSSDLQKQIVALSTTYRVLSPFTSLLVLETEQDYARFNLDRTATANILSFEEGRLVLAGRRRPPRTAPSRPRQRSDEDMKEDRGEQVMRGVSAAIAPNAPAPAERELSDPLAARGNMWGGEVGDAFGAGGLGLSGVGEGGGGQGEGIGFGSLGMLGRGAGAGQASGSHASRAPSLRQGATTVSGRLPPEVIQRIVRQNFGRFRHCYQAGLRVDPSLAGSVAVAFEIDSSGAVRNPTDSGSTLASPSVVQCVVSSFSSLSFPQPEGGTVRVVYPIAFAPAEGGDSAPRVAIGAPQGDRPPAAHPYTGRMKSVMDLVAAKAPADALRAAKVWHDETPADVMSIVALGEAEEASGNANQASRAYGSIVDLFPNRADLRRYAGERMERLRSNPVALAVAIDTYRKAVADRPDHPSSHRLLAFALVRDRQFESAFAAIAKGIEQHYPSNRFAGVDRILREDAGLIGAAWIKSDPKRRAAVEERLRALGAKLEDAPSLRFVLNWESDANDVDFHIFDDQGNHASFRNPKLASGGDLYADVTTGYGPECFTIRKPKKDRANSYTLQAHYYSRGPMGYGMGKLEVVEHDGNGELTFDERPFVVMVDSAFVDLGTVAGRR